MRVISGKARGLKLNAPQGIETRPTLDRVKEAIFSMILPYMADSSVLDLFAGSGGLGIEAISRGAGQAFFVDNNVSAINCIKQNLASLRFEANSAVLHTDAESFLKSTAEKFDIIFLDPPYFEGMYEKIINLIQKYKVLTDDGIIVVEWDAESGFPDKLGDFCVLKEKRYGRVGVTVLKWG